jgi:SAM-dependent methyltransferase
MTDVPSLSVVLNTYNRDAIVGRAVDSVLQQSFDRFELIVVDDGSTDETARVVAEFTDQRLRYVHQGNAGLAAARNAGARAARGRWLAFLDDDDFALEGWAATLASAEMDDRVSVVCGGVQLFTPGGDPSGALRPSDLGPLFGGRHGLFLAGAFAVRTDVFMEAGGYLDGMSASHQTELGMRIAALSRERDFRFECSDRLIVGITRRAAQARPVATPEQLYYGARWLLERHRTAFDASAAARADYEAIAGVNAARLDRWGDARQHLWRSALAAPTRPKAWSRVAGSVVPSLGRRLWGTEAAWSRHTDASPLRQVPASPEDVPETLFLPWRYERNEQSSADSAGRAFWEGGTDENDVRYQDPVYRYAARYARRNEVARVLDVGCGSGHKLARHFGREFPSVVGIDQPSAIAIARREFPELTWEAGDFVDPRTWVQLREMRPQLVLCADVIEHLDEPRRLLEQLHELMDGHSVLVLSTPDRDRLGTGAAGPPRNPRHVREWSMEGLLLLVEAVGFEVVLRKHVLPRRYSLTRTELNRTVWRALHLQSVPDRRSNSLLVLRRTP